MNAPACPKCGCPPRNMTTLRRVSVDIGVTRDGVVLEHGDYRVGKIAEETAEYRCGAGHRWRGPVVTADQRRPVKV